MFRHLLKKDDQTSLASELEVQNFSIKHLDAVLDIEKEANPTPWSKKTFENILNRRTMSFVCLLKAQIVGFCIASEVLDECHLQNISVKKDFRHKGVGRYMFSILFQRSKLFDIKNTFLEVRESNLGARNFYDKLGFREITKRADYYETGNGREAAVILRLTH